jgi:hypothetical protein
MKCKEETLKSKLNFLLMIGQPMMPIAGNHAPNAPSVVPSCGSAADRLYDVMQGEWRLSVSEHLPHSRVLQSTCLLEHSRQSGIANCVCLVSFVASQRDVLNNNFTSASAFLLSRFVLFHPPFLYFLPSFHHIFVPNLFLLFHSVSYSTYHSAPLLL